MSTIVPRTVSSQERNSHNKNVPLASFRDRAAYVLLGEPGAGKTTVFKTEAAQSQARYIEARNFVIEDLEALRNETLFIDGLDEMRAGDGGSDGSFHEIRKRLTRLGCPRFRISCRAADWHGSRDAEDLERTAPDGTLIELILDSLDDSQVKAVLRNVHGIPDPEAFVTRARDHGIEDLLRNPQLLALLVKATQVSWPDRKELVFQLACEQLLQEQNPRHRDADRRSPIDDNRLWRAAGYACAVILLSGAKGIALDRASADAAFPAREEFDFDDASALDAAIRRMLFACDSKPERLSPIHRTVAEYLAARFVADQINVGPLSMARVVAMLSGRDGGVVAPLRGLHAWLAVLCTAARRACIERDPLGVILNGDASAFPIDEKVLLLSALERDANDSVGAAFREWSEPAFGALATRDMERSFRDRLTAHDRSHAHQFVLRFVLVALRYGQAIPELFDAVESIIRDKRYEPGVRAKALDVLIEKSATDRLLRLLDDIHADRIDDGNDRLLASLLSDLYPTEIPPNRVADYLHPAKNPDYIGDYHCFWRVELFKNTPPGALPILLDRLAELRPLRNVDHWDYLVHEFVALALARCLEECGAAASPARLRTWLSVGLGAHGVQAIHSPRHVVPIRDWLADHPDHYKAILKLGIEGCLDEDNKLHCLISQENLLYGAHPPKDLGVWLLDLAATIGDEAVADCCFDKAIGNLLAGNRPNDAALETLESWVAAHPRFAARFAGNGYIVQPIHGNWVQEDHERYERHIQDERERKRAWLQGFHEFRAELRANAAPPGALRELGRAYFGRLHGADGDSPHARLAHVFDNDEDLIDTALIALRHAPLRDDLPAADEILSQYQKRYSFAIGDGVLAGAEELTAQDTRGILTLGDDALRRLVAFHLTSVANEPPDWLHVLAESRPELVAEVYLAFAIPHIRKGKQDLPLAYQLARDDRYGAVAKRSLPAILESFPLRMRKEQLNVLGKLLAAGLRHLDVATRMRIIGTRLARSGLDTAQQAYWLGAGLLTQPGRFEQSFDEYVGNSQTRSAHLAAFFRIQVDEHGFVSELSVSTLELLVRHLAPHCLPDRKMGAYRVTPAMETADLVRSLVERLGSIAGDDATAAFGRLIAAPALTRWHDVLRAMGHQQQVASRESFFSHPTVQAVQQTLRAEQPANHADLLALVEEHLRAIAHDIHDGATDDYKLFWDANQPKYENDCRDVLLGKLKVPLERLRVDASPEGQYADDKRADIRVWFGGTGKGINVPIEIKRESHEDLWKGIYEQLVPRYARDPGANGYGMYVVFWFNHKIQRPVDGGRAPRSSGELEDRLRASLRPEDRHRIRICVIDCSAP